MTIQARSITEYFTRTPTVSATVITDPKPSFHGFISTGPDGGALQMLRRCTLPVWSHGSVDELGTNIVRAFQQQPTSPRNGLNLGATILGHGGPGYVDAGDGSWNDSDEGSIQLRNEARWAKYFEQIAAPTVLYPRPVPTLPPIPMYRGVHFLSCSTGAGNGRLLMQRIADIGNLVVSAWTGLVLVTNRYWFAEPGANRVQCIPSNATDVSREHYRPETNWGEPTGPKPSSAPGDQKMLTRHLDAMLSSLTAIEVTRVRGPSARLTGAVAERLAAKVFYVGPFAMDGQFVGATLTNMRLEFTDKAPLTLGIIANRVAVTSDGMAYFVDPALQLSLSELGI